MGGGGKPSTSTSTLIPNTHSRTLAQGEKAHTHACTPTHKAHDEKALNHGLGGKERKKKRKKRKKGLNSISDMNE